jgi:KAP family P-loop domain
MKFRKEKPKSGDVGQFAEAEDSEPLADPPAEPELTSSPPFAPRRGEGVSAAASPQQASNESGPQDLEDIAPADQRKAILRELYSLYNDKGPFQYYPTDSMKSYRRGDLYGVVLNQLLSEGLIVGTTIDPDSKRVAIALNPKRVGDVKQELAEVKGSERLTYPPAEPEPSLTSSPPFAPRKGEGVSAAASPQQASNESGPQDLEDIAPADSRPLPTEPAWVNYESELERVCRIAAHVGVSQPAPISYTALIIAFLWAEGPISTWFREFVGANRSIDTEAIYRSKAVPVDGSSKYLTAANSLALPAADPLYSRSARNLLDQAVRIAREVAHSELTKIELGTRHLMAAYAFRNPSDHVDQVRGWGFDPDAWRFAFKTFAVRFNDQYNEDWSRLGHAVLSSAPVIGSFTADDPLSTQRDLLGIEDEAAAFARIIAAGDVKPPLAIGVFGEWGSGKTFFMRRIHDTVKALSDGADERALAGASAGPFLPDIVQIRFNAWHYIETNLWASLVEYIFTELDRWLQNKTRNTKADAEQVFNRLATAQQLKLDALDGVITRRAERRSAELRAERARREYEEALVRVAGVGAGTYARALMDTLLSKIGDALGVPYLADSSGRILDALAEARSEAGRTQLVMRAGIARLGTWPWIVSIVLVLVGMPLLAVGVRNVTADLVDWPALKEVHETVLALSGVLAGVAAWGGVLLRRASAALKKLDAFEKRLRKLADERKTAEQGGPAAAKMVEAEDDVRKRKQALDAAERALAEAEARLNEARTDFESVSARSRLNAFIRAKATDGNYAKHLGIIAAVRRDFGQLTTLMGAANNSDEQRAENERLAEEMHGGVVRFLERIATEPDVRLSIGEVRSLLTLLESERALELLKLYRTRLIQYLEGEDALQSIEVELKSTNTAPFPKFSRIVLYIDDLDRCLPQVVVDVLQAVHLLLCFPLFTVVVAVDARWVSRALHDQFPSLLGETGRFANTGPVNMGAGASSQDYLEKIFQIPYWVRPVDPESATRYVNTLVEADVRRIAVAAKPSAGGVSAANVGTVERNLAPLRKGGGTSDVDMPSQTSVSTENTAPTAAAVGLELTRWEADALERFAPLISGTPRRLIRFVNLYRLLKTGLASGTRQRLVGERGESDVYRSLIVQLAIVTGAPSAAPLYFTQLEAMEGDEAISAVLKSSRKCATVRWFSA